MFSPHAAPSRLAPRGLLVIASALVFHCARAPSGYVEVVLDTDVPRGVTMTVTVRVVPLRSGEDARAADDASDDVRSDTSANRDGGDASATDASATDASATDANTPDANTPDANTPHASGAPLAVDPTVRRFGWTRSTGSLL